MAPVKYLSGPILEALRVAIDPIRPTDQGARDLGRGLLRSSRQGALATLGPDGHPFASLTSLATDQDGTPLILISALSAHTGNLGRDPRCSLLLAPGGKGDPLAHPRVTLVTTAEPIERDGETGERVRRRFLARHPKAGLYVDFPDFSLHRLTLLRASLNGGFGRAYELEPSDLLSRTGDAGALLEAEVSAVDHMNADHADTVRLYATVLLGAEDGPWRITGIDPDGLDLALADRALRLGFQGRITDPDRLRAVLAELARTARAKSAERN